MAGFVRVIWGRGEVVYFCERDWTGQITLKFLGKIDFTRAPRASKNGFGSCANLAYTSSSRHSSTGRSHFPAVAQSSLALSIARSE
jgi:hypothetical protein